MTDYTVQEVLQFVEENDVKFIRLAFCDLFGTLKKYCDYERGTSAGICQRHLLLTLRPSRGL